MLIEKFANTNARPFRGSLLFDREYNVTDVNGDRLISQDEFLIYYALYGTASRHSLIDRRESPEILGPCVFKNVWDIDSNGFVDFDEWTAARASFFLSAAEDDENLRYQCAHGELFPWDGRPGINCCYRSVLHVKQN